MARIKLIVTGDMEELSLHESLRRFFPAKRNGEEVIWDDPRRLSGATTHRLTPGKGPSQPMMNLAQAMLDEALKGKRRGQEPADLVIVVDDVELDNLDREAVIIEHFRAAIHAKLNMHSSSTRDRYRQVLQQNCSFHLLKPMVESYLFGDFDALGVAGVPASVSPRLVYPDVEQFETDDPGWLPACHAENEKKRKAKMAWWVHERHPKRYLEYLTAQHGTGYDETAQGKDALIGLRWGQVPKSAGDVAVIRCLFEDLSDWFMVPSPLGGTHAGLWPIKAVNRASLLLRNL